MVPGRAIPDQDSEVVNDVADAVADQVTKVEREIAQLRFTGREAENRSADASDQQAGRRSEWLMQTIERYSVQLEEAWTRIGELENQLAQRRVREYEGIAALAAGLRAPLTSIYGYTDLFLAENVQLLSETQTMFLRRVQANAERLEQIAERIADLTLAHRDQDRSEVLGDTLEEIDAAIHRILPQIRKKRLLLHLEIDPSIRSFVVRRNDLGSIVGYLLSNACQASPNGSKVILNMHTDSISTDREERERDEETFLHVEVKDSGSGVRITDLPRLFVPPSDQELRPIYGIGDTRTGLWRARELVHANGGRIWVAPAADMGSTFSVLFPVIRTPSPNGGQA